MSLLSIFALTTKHIAPEWKRSAQHMKFPFHFFLSNGKTETELTLEQKMVHLFFTNFSLEEDFYKKN